MTVRRKTSSVRRGARSFQPQPVDERQAPRVDRRYRGTADDWVQTGRWVNVKSSNVKAIRYDRINKKLFVQFKDSRVYWYMGIQTRTAKDMFGAASLGKFVWRRLRDKYPYGIHHIGRI